MQVKSKKKNKQNKMSQEAIEYLKAKAKTEEKYKYYLFRQYVLKHPFLNKDLANRGRVHRLVLHRKGVPNINCKHDNMPNHYHVIMEWDPNWMYQRMKNGKGVVPDKCMKHVIHEDGSGYGQIKDENHWYNHNKYLDAYEPINQNTCESMAEDQPVSDDEDAVSVVSVQIQDEVPSRDAVRAENTTRPQGTPKLKSNKMQEFLQTLHPNVAFLEKKEFFQLYDEAKLKEGYDIDCPSFVLARNTHWNYIQGWRRNIEDRMYNKPLECKDFFKLQNQDKNFKQNLYYLRWMMELMHKKKNIYKKTPILWLTGIASSGKTEFANMVGLALGKVANIEQCNMHKDNLIYDTAAKQNCDVVILEEYKLDEMKPDILEKQFQQLKAITSGIDHEVRTAKTSKERNQQWYIKLEAVIICTNNHADEIEHKIMKDSGVNNRSCIFHFEFPIDPKNRWSAEERKQFRPLYVRMARNYFKERTNGTMSDEEAQKPKWPESFIRLYKDNRTIMTGMPKTVEETIAKGENVDSDEEWVEYDGPMEWNE